jgi:oligoendopeptidase F
MKIAAPERKFIDKDLSIQTWEDIESYFIDLKNRIINSKEDYILWLQNRSELDAVLEENSAWRLSLIHI